jgi:hypothetical protein
MNDTTDITKDENQKKLTTIERRKLLRLCMRCGANLEEGNPNYTCEKCKEQIRIESKKKYNYLKQLGVCPTCKGKIYGDEIICLDCRTKSLIRHDKNYAKNRERNLARDSELAKERRKKWQEMGLCTKCGKRTPEATYKKCAICREKDKLAYAKYVKSYNGGVYKKRAINNLCRFCGGECVKGYRVCENHLQMIRNRKPREEMRV